MKKIKKLYKKYEEMINYIIVGGFTTIVSLGTYYLLTISLLNPNNPILLQIANIISWITSVTFAFFTNKKYVFKSNNKKINECIKFYSSRVFTLILDIFFMFLFVSLFKINDKIAKLVVQIIIMIGNYLISKFIVFKKED